MLRRNGLGLVAWEGNLLRSMAPLFLTCLLSLSCQKKPFAPAIGTSLPEPDAEPAAPKSPADATTQPEPASLPEGQASLPLPELDEQTETRLAEEALAKTTAEPDLGLALVVVDRAADLPWIVALQNRSGESIQLLADGALIRFEISPPQKPEEAPADGTIHSSGASKSSPSTKPGVTPKVPFCGYEKAPSLSKEPQRIELSPGQILVHPIDPRTFCKDGKLLTAGSKVTLSYGFPIESKKLWSQGRSQVVELRHEAPYAFSRPLAPEAEPPPGSKKVPKPKGAAPLTPLDPAVRPASLRQLVAVEFELGNTYPLSSVKVSSAPMREDGSAGPKAPPEAAPGKSAEGSAPSGTTEAPSQPKANEPVWALRIGQIGSIDEVDGTTVQVTLENRGSTSQRVFLRREAFVYEVLGPSFVTTCRMQPNDRAPDPSSFDTMAPGASRSFTTRLAEACAPATFTAKGRYSVGARFEARHSGGEHGLTAFVGDVRSEEPARLTVRGATSASGRGFRLLPLRSPAP